MSSHEVDAAMPSPTEITVAQLSRLIGLPDAPALVDVRSDEEYQADARLLPTARHQASNNVAGWCGRYNGRPVVVVCRNGGAPSQAVAAGLRHEGLGAQTLEGGYDAWCNDR